MKNNFISDDFRIGRPSVQFYGMSKAWRIGFLTLCTVCFCCQVTTMAYSAPGDFDPSFGDAGYIITKFYNNEGLSNGGARAMVIRSDGKIIAGGSMHKDDPGGHNLALARYDVQGNLDNNSFGVGGLVLTEAPGSVFTWDEIGQALIQLRDNGKLVLAGCQFNHGLSTPVCDLESHPIVARYNEDGSQDNTFGNNGVVSINFGANGYGIINALAEQPDGKLVLAGYLNVISSTQESDLFLTRLLQTGELDTSFGNNGVVYTDFADEFNEAFALVIQPEDGKLVVAGYTGTNPGNLAETKGYRDFLLVRYSKDGELDTSSFGTNGFVHTPIESFPRSVARALLLQPDGKLVAAGDADDGVSRDFVLVRYDDKGKPDTGFGNDHNGIVRTSFSSTGHSKNSARTLLLQPNDHKLIAAGYSTINSTEIATARYNPDGRLDASFGSNGLIRRDLSGSGHDNSISALALDVDNKLLFAGSVDTGAAIGVGNKEGFMLGRLFTGLETQNVDLSVTLSDSPDPVTVGGKLTYTANVHNNGIDSAANALLVFSLPTNVIEMDTGCTANGATVTCELGTLAAGASLQKVLSIKPATSGNLTASAQVTSDTSDAVPSDNQISVDTSVVVATSEQPIAVVSAEVTGILGKAVRLDGSQSHAPTAAPNALKYQWTFISGPAQPKLLKAKTAKPRFYPPLPGDYVYSLQVSNANGSSAVQNTTIHVPASLSITLPVGGSLWQLGAANSLSWQIQAISPNQGLSIYLSTDGGNTWQRIKSKIKAGKGQIFWKPANTARNQQRWLTEQAKLRICVPASTRNQVFCSDDSELFSIEK